VVGRVVILDGAAWIRGRRELRARRAGGSDEPHRLPAVGPEPGDRLGHRGRAWDRELEIEGTGAGDAAIAHVNDVGVLAGLGGQREDLQRARAQVGTKLELAAEGR